MQELKIVQIYFTIGKIVFRILQKVNSEIHIHVCIIFTQ